MRRLLLLLISGWLGVTAAIAAPAVIGTPASGNIGASIGTSLTFAATCPSGNTNVIAILCANVRRSGAGAASLGVTWNGVAMTSVGIAGTGASDAAHAEMFQLINPTCDSSSHNVVITQTGNSHMIVGNIVFLKDVNLSSPLDTAATATGASTSPTVNVSSAIGDLVVDCVTVRNSNTNIVAGSGQTSQSVNQTINGTPNANGEGGQSTEPGAAPTVTMNWTDDTTSVGWAQIGVSVNPVAVSAQRRVPPGYVF